MHKLCVISMLRPLWCLASALHSFPIWWVLMSSTVQRLNSWNQTRLCHVCEPRQQTEQNRTCNYSWALFIPCLKGHFYFTYIDSKYIQKYDDALWIIWKIMALTQQHLFSFHTASRFPKKEKGEITSIINGINRNALWSRKH